jgi:WD domain, G-beta repeat
VCEAEGVGCVGAQMGTGLELGAEPGLSLATRLVYEGVPKEPGSGEQGGGAGGGGRGGQFEEGGQRGSRKKAGPVPSLCWCPDTRHLISGTNYGYVCLWYGDSFNFDTVTTITSQAIRCMAWRRAGDYMLCGDEQGNVTFLGRSLASLAHEEAHERNPVRGLAFAPSDERFASCGEDGRVRVWDLWTRKAEVDLGAHRMRVTSVDYHPVCALVASGSGDSVYLWDPRVGAGGDALVRRLPFHRQAVNSVRFNRNGYWLLSTAEDQSVVLSDLRRSAEPLAAASVAPDVGPATVAAWHPFHERLFSTGHASGQLAHWIAGEPAPVAAIPAHDDKILSIDYHPLGHVLSTGSQDQLLKHWGRPRPGDRAEQYAYRGKAAHMAAGAAGAMSSASFAAAAPGASSFGMRTSAAAGTHFQHHRGTGTSSASLPGADFHTRHQAPYRRDDRPSDAHHPLPHTMLPMSTMPTMPSVPPSMAASYGAHAVHAAHAAHATHAAHAAGPPPAAHMHMPMQTAAMAVPPAPYYAPPPPTYPHAHPPPHAVGPPAATPPAPRQGLLGPPGAAPPGWGGPQWPQTQ